MIDSTKCPVCGRKDIPDYHQGDVRCPYCGSNLKVFRLLDNAEMDSKAKSTVWKPVGILALLAAAIFALLYFTKGPSPTAAKERISLLEDSIASMNEKLREQPKGEVVAAPLPSAGTTDSKTEAVNASQSEKAKQEGTANEEAKADDGITAPADKVTIENGKKYYVVQKGDSWWKISQKLYKGKVKDVDLARMNGRRATEPLEIGDKLLVK